MPSATLPGWVTDTGQIAIAFAAVLACIAAISKWIQRGIGRMIDEKLDPIYDRLDAHMSEEDRSLRAIAEAFKTLSEHLDPDR